MGELVRLREDGPLGKAGTEVWVNDGDSLDKPERVKHEPAKKAAAKKTAAKPE